MKTIKKHDKGGVECRGAMLSNNFDTRLKGTKNEHAVSTKKTLQAPFNPLFKRTSIALIIITPPGHLNFWSQQ